MFNSATFVVRNDPKSQRFVGHALSKRVITVVQLKTRPILDAPLLKLRIGSNFGIAINHSWVCRALSYFLRLETVLVALTCTLAASIETVV